MGHSWLSNPGGGTGVGSPKTPTDVVDGRHDCLSALVGEKRDEEATEVSVGQCCFFKGPKLVSKERIQRGVPRCRSLENPEREQRPSVSHLPIRHVAIRQGTAEREVPVDVETRAGALKPQGPDSR